MKFVLFSDIDGTLFQDHTLVQEDIDAVRRFRAEGNLFILCTGRTPPSVQQFLDDHPQLECDGAVLAGGSGISRASGSPIMLQPIEQKMIDKQVSWDIINYIYQHEPRVSIHWSDGARRVSVTDRHIQKLGSAVSELMSIEEWIAQDKEMLVLVLANMDLDVSEIQRVQKEVLKRWGNIIEGFTNNHFLDVSTKGADKGSGIQRAIEILAPNAHYFGIGDGFNDVPMFKTLGKEHSFLISSGETSLQPLAQTSVVNVATCIQQLLDKKALQG
ncbi:MAG: HAD-IIB family hydrolase [Brevinema sp.]